MSGLTGTTEALWGMIIDQKREIGELNSRVTTAYESGFNDGKSSLPAATEAARGVATLLARIQELEAENARLLKVLTGNNARMDGLAALLTAEEQSLKVLPGERHTEFVKRIARSYNQRALAHQAVAEQNRLASESELP